MKIFVAGATGVIGRRLVPMLVERDHDVVGMTRSQERSEALRDAGAQPAVCDVYDANRLKSVLVEARPDVVIHELTDIPPVIDPRKYAEQFAGNDRVRTEGTHNLMRAAASAGVSRAIAQSISIAYAPVGGWVKTEEDPLYDDAPQPFRRSVEALHELESAVTGRPGIDGVILRYGLLYGPGTGYASDGYLANLVRQRKLPIVGRGDAVTSFIHVDDAVAATVAALEGSPGVYNVVDDDPAPAREWLPAYARALGAPRPRHVPAIVVRLVGGSYTTFITTQMRGAANAKAKRELTGALRYPSWRDGFKTGLG